MPRQNEVELYGFVDGNPRFKTDKEGNLIEARFILQVTRRKIQVPGKEYVPKFYHPIIKTCNTEMIEKIMDFQPYDMIEILGVYTTQYDKKISRCPNCGSPNKEEGSAAFVTPMSLIKRETKLTKEEAYKLLLDRAETSNRVSVCGTVCGDIKKTEKNNTVFCRYPLAVNRKYRIEGDIAEIHTDYPYVKSCGDKAKTDIATLSLGSTVMIDAGISTRIVSNKHTKCSNCGKDYVWSDYVMELYEYNSEYLFNNRIAKESTLRDLLQKILPTVPIELRLDEINTDDICNYNNKNEIPDELYPYVYSCIIPNADKLIIVISEPIETLSEKIEREEIEDEYEGDEEIWQD